MQNNKRTKTSSSQIKTFEQQETIHKYPNTTEKTKKPKKQKHVKKRLSKSNNFPFKSHDRNTNKQCARIFLAMNAPVTIFAPCDGACKTSPLVSANTSSTFTGAPNVFTIIFTLFNASLQ